VKGAVCTGCPFNGAGVALCALQNGWISMVWLYKVVPLRELWPPFSDIQLPTSESTDFRIMY
jgi:hypothetical protein